MSTEGNEAARTIPTEGAQGEVHLGPDSQRFVSVNVLTPSAVHGVIRAPARVSFRDEALARVGAPVEGRVSKLSVSLGDRVAPGTPLLTLQSSAAAEQRTALSRAEVAVRAAQAEADRQDRMFDKGVGTESEKVAADLALAAARADAAGARDSAQLLGKGSGSVLVLTSPIAGTVLRRNVTAGAAVSADGSALIEIGDPSSVWIVADVFERDLPSVQAGAAVKVAIGSATEPLDGRVVKIGSSFEEGMRRAPVYIELAQAPHELRPGTFARVEIGMPGGNALLAPRASVLISSGENYFVFVEREPAVYERRAVTIGSPIGDDVPLLSGIKPGDRVVTSGAILLDGAASQLL